MADWQCPACKALWIDRDNAEPVRVTWANGDQDWICSECAEFYESPEARRIASMAGTQPPKVER